MTTVKRRCELAGVLLASLTICSHCYAVPPASKKTWPWSKPKAQEIKYETPVKMAVIWSPALFNEVGKPPTRGFGGRIYFYSGANKPMPVAGQLVIYAYDDTKLGGDGKTPDRKFVFTPDQFTQHLKPTELGDSYSVWIPWDEAGKPQLELSLVPIFTAASGAIVIGQSSRNTLPGPTTPAPTSQVQNFALPPPELRRASGFDSSPPAYPAQQIAYQQPNSAAPGQQPSAGYAQNSSIDTLSIPLSGAMADRLTHASPQASIPQQTAAQPFTPLQAAAMAARVPLAQAAPAAFQPAPPAVRYEPAKPQVPGVRAFPPTAGQALRPPFHAAPPSAPPALPQSSLNLLEPASWPGAPKIPH